MQAERSQQPQRDRIMELQLKEQAARLNQAPLLVCTTCNYIVCSQCAGRTAMETARKKLLSFDLKERAKAARVVGSEFRPLHVYLHGGGWCVGDLDQPDPRCRTIATEASCTVASVDYRMAPENAFPVPLEDCYAALVWLVDQADQLGVDVARVSVGGESAGANLAALVALLARDRNGPPLVFQWLDVPATDLTMTQPSIDRLATGYGLTKAGMEEYRAAYLRDVDPKDPYVSPLHHDDLTGLPPALIATMEYDPLQDDGTAYAQRLREAGVAVEHHHLPGMVHASFAFTRLLPRAREYEQTAIAALRRAYA